MSPTWRRGTAPVSHPVVLSAIGSSGQCEPAMEYIDLRNRYRMAALKGHDQKLLNLHLRRAEGGDSEQAARSEDLLPRSDAAVRFPRPLPTSCAARRPVAGPPPPPRFASRALRPVPPTSCPNAANRHLPPTVLGCHAHSPHYWPSLLPRWHVSHLGLIVLLLASIFPGRFSVSVKLHLLSALIISSLPANR